MWAAKYAVLFAASMTDAPGQAAAWFAGGELVGRADDGMPAAGYAPVTAGTRAAADYRRYSLFVTARPEELKYGTRRITTICYALL